MKYIHIIHTRSGHPMVHFKVPGELFSRKVKPRDEITMNTMEQMYGNLQHENIPCDNCKIQSISGLRFKCDTCPNVNLCQQCVMRNNSNISNHRSDHPLILISKEIIQVLNKKDIELREPLGQGAFGKYVKIGLIIITIFD